VREPKYRGWTSNSFIYDIDIGFDFSGELVIPIEYQQFIGIEATNGEDVYEGDYLIVWYTDGQGCHIHMDGEVIYEDCRFIVFSKEYNRTLWLGSGAITKILVIGNKFENEGLLDEAKT